MRHMTRTPPPNLAKFRGVAAEKSKEDFDRHFAIVVSGAERTRGVLYFFCLVLIVNVVFFFEDAFNTSGRRLDIMSGAVACFGSGLDQFKPVPVRGEFYKRHPNCGYYYKYAKDYYHINISADDPKSTDELTKNVLFEKYKAVLKDDTDYLSTSIPLLNIKVDRNDGLILQNTMAVIILAVLFFSIKAERQSLLTAGTIAGTDRFRIWAILDTHVFNRATAGRAVLWCAVFLPAVMQVYRLWQDLGEDSEVVRDLYGPTWGTIYLIVEPVTLLATLFVAGSCVFQIFRLNRELHELEQKAVRPLLRGGERQ
jgi:hypothetical protein